jgi:NAD(P)-dependent dehydrogenase (short-subunit alcohol dehydrogenase family)
VQKPRSRPVRDQRLHNLPPARLVTPCGHGPPVPLKRPASAEEIACVVAFAASPEASYVGAIIGADGGRTAV